MGLARNAQTINFISTDLLRNVAIAVCRDRDHLDPSPKPPLTENEINLICLKIYEYEIARIWTLHLECGNPSAFPFPISTASAKPYKPLGEVLFALSNLSSKLHNLEVPVSIRYRSGAAWWRAVYGELLCCACLWAITEIKDPPPRIKRGLLDSLREELNLLKTFENPVTPADRMPATQGLFDAAIELAQARWHPNFNREFYQPFLKTVAANIQARTGKAWGCVRKDEAGRLYVFTGKGKARVYLPIPEDVKNYLSAESVAG